jgi:hypothetical protein
MNHDDYLEARLEQADQEGAEFEQRLDAYIRGLSDREWLNHLSDAIDDNNYVPNRQGRPLPEKDVYNGLRCKALRDMFEQGRDAEIGKAMRNWLNAYMRQCLEAREL